MSRFLRSFPAKKGLNAAVSAARPVDGLLGSPTMNHARFLGYDVNKTSVSNDKTSRLYSWVTEEAEVLIAKAYARHHVDGSLPNYHTPCTQAELEALDVVYHYKPETMLDYVAYGTMRFLRRFTHGYFKERYASHALLLETVAAVPGTVGSAFRHLRCLRTMKTDHGWIAPLQEEAENERMHLLIWMEYTKPTYFERLLVIGAQAAYLSFYTGLYIFSPQSSHRMVGYLEEEAHFAYNAFLKSIDEGKLPNDPAPLIAIKYYGLNEDARIRDVVLRVRADECMHRDFNHHLANKIKNGDSGSHPVFPGGLGEADPTVKAEEVKRVNL